MSAWRRALDRLLLPSGPAVVRYNVRAGGDYGGWDIDPTLLGPDSIVYSFGVGFDVSFDLAMIERFGCRVFAFDPTPRSVAWVASQTLPSDFVFAPVGIAARDGSARFTPPADPAHASFRPGDGPDAVEAPVRTLRSLADERGHTRIDVLKLDIEGFEIDVVDDILARGPHPIQWLIEVHPTVTGYAAVRRMLRRITDAGWRVFARSGGGREYSLYRR